MQVKFSCFDPNSQYNHKDKYTFSSDKPLSYCKSHGSNIVLRVLSAIHIIRSYLCQWVGGYLIQIQHSVCT